MKKTASYIIQEMEKLFPDAHCELKFSNPFQLLLSVVLSAQTTDEQVNKVTKDFFQVVSTPDDVIELGEEGIKKYIKTVGLHKSKAKNIYNLAKLMKDFSEDYCEGKECKKIYKKYGYIIPDTMDGIMKLSGVGEKTAKVVLHLLYSAKVVPVDTHIHRISNRLGLVNTNSPLQTSRELEKIIPEELKGKAHHLMIFFGRYLCKAKSPECNKCPFTDFCFYYNGKL